jgi:hypothetical protein
MIDMARIYGAAQLPAIEYSVRVEHLYPIPTTRRTSACETFRRFRQARGAAELHYQWQPDADADGELTQIKAERRADDALRHGTWQESWGRRGRRCSAWYEHTRRRPGRDAPAAAGHYLRGGPGERGDLQRAQEEWPGKPETRDPAA